ncbi:ABC transporter substrate-binding protein [Bosea caraganae]|uniref:ABC transporter substrate-binding protein n=1 Tax=Bosea caraganae TaxID=2763117 RepID=A0A370L0R7_9HYPH|nr:ABC transporter substrate-binding protein [Bosea caraganae]RDJ20797.1 ABC transporter substrate-binding protein [Bosea caraganae]RDJ21590.1 ABC transporter substrate-binding protein [Bosea caraganae]
MTTRRDLLAGAGLAALAVQLPATAFAQVRDSVIVAMTLEPPTLDPTSGAAQAIREVTLQNIFEGLVKMDRAGKIVPCLAESWQVAPDNLTYTFKLRQGARFHDGAPFSSEQVKFSFERAVAPDSTNAQRQLFTPIAEIATPDPETVVIKLKQPTALFLYGLAWGDAVIVAPASAANNKTNPVGTGPFKFVRWNRGDRLELERFDGYWGEKPALAKATFRFISDPQAQVASLLAGDVDAQTNLAAPEAVAQLKASPKLKVTFGKTEGEVILGINNAKAPFSDLRVRQAIAHVLDRKTIALGVYGFDVDLIGSHFSPLHPAYIDLTNTYPVDIPKAKALLAQAGFPNGFNCTLKLPPPAYARRSGEIIAALLQQIGINASIEPLEFPQWLERVFRGKDFDLTVIAHTEPLDIGIYARDDYYFQYKNPAFKELMARIDATLDEGQRNELYKEAQRILARDAVNGYLFVLPKITVTAAGLEGMWTDWPLPITPLGEVRWK